MLTVVCESGVLRLNRKRPTPAGFEPASSLADALYLTELRGGLKQVPA